MKDTGKYGSTTFSAASDPPQSEAELAPLPSALRISAARGVVEIKKFFRDRSAFVSSCGFPIVLLVFFGAIFSFDMGPIDATLYYLPAMLTLGLMSVSFLNVAVSIATERDDGTLKRLRGTPMPKSAYFGGKVLLVLTVGLAEAALLIAIAGIFFGIDLPTAPVTWGTFAWVVTLGVGASTLLGIAVSRLPRSGSNAAAVINLPFILLNLVSGVFIPLQALPEWVRYVGVVFPPRWLNQGLQSVFLPESVAKVGPVNSWQHGMIALVLGAWCLGGLVLCLATFRWMRES